jgi:uncharacterized protein YndB with AHSA1/START domain
VTVKRKRTVAAAPDAVWDLVSDPHHLPRWWPQVQRVEEVTGDAWTKVLRTPKGKTVRADYTRVEWRPPTMIVWRQEVEESPFERLLAEATTELELEPEPGGGTRVRLTLNQRPRGWARFSPFQLRAAAARQAEGALEGLAGLAGEPS